jgi:two-component system response regulator NreC
LSNESIGAHLSISKHTVARHREHIMRKLGLHSRSELVKFAIRKGLINP